MTTPLPENISALYPDASAGDIAHQSHHDIIHAAINNLPDVAGLSAHTGAADPHPVYLTAAEGAAAYVSKGSMVFNVKDYGAVGNGVANDYAAVQAAITAASGNSLFFPKGTYKVDTVLTIPANTKLFGAGSAVSILASGSNNVISVPNGTWVYNQVFEDIGFSSTAGHLFSIGTGSTISNSTWNRCTFVIYSNTKSAIDMPDGGFLGNLIEQCQFTHTLTATVPTVRLISTSYAANSNTFRRLWVTNTGNYAFWLEAPGGGAYCYDNTFQDICWEITNGGCINLLSCMNTLIEQCGSYDMGTTTKDQYNVSRSATGPGLSSRLTTFKHASRRGGTLGASLVDIRIGNALNTTFENCSSSTMGGYLVDAAGQPGVIIGAGIMASNDTALTRTDAYTTRTGTGATGVRPSAVSQGVGAQYFDTTLNKPIWSDGAVWNTYAGDLPQAWTAYTPTLAGTGWAIGNGTITGAWVRLGRTIHWRAAVVFGSTSTFGSASPTISLPVTAVDATHQVSRVRVTDAGSGTFILDTLASTTVVALWGSSGANGGIVTVNATFPHIWAAPDTIQLSGTYEAAS